MCLSIYNLYDFHYSQGIYTTWNDNQAYEVHKAEDVANLTQRYKENSSLVFAYREVQGKLVWVTREDNQFIR